MAPAQTTYAKIAVEPIWAATIAGSTKMPAPTVMLIAAAARVQTPITRSRDESEVLNLGSLISRNGPRLGERRVPGA